MRDSPSQIMTGSKRSTMTGSVVNSIDHERRNTMSSSAARMFSPPPSPVTTCSVQRGLTSCGRSSPLGMQQNTYGGVVKGVRQAQGCQVIRMGALQVYATSQISNA